MSGREEVECKSYFIENVLLQCDENIMVREVHIE